jgi:hypothetical protein
MMLTKAIRPELTATGDRQPDDLAGRIRVLKNDGDDKNQNTSDRRHPPLCSPCNRIANMTMTTFQGKLVHHPTPPPPLRWHSADSPWLIDESGIEAIELEVEELEEPSASKPGAASLNRDVLPSTLKPGRRQHTCSFEPARPLRDEGRDHRKGRLARHSKSVFSGSRDAIALSRARNCFGRGRFQAVPRQAGLTAVAEAMAARRSLAKAEDRPLPEFLWSGIH